MLKVKASTGNEIHVSPCFWLLTTRDSNVHLCLAKATLPLRTLGELSCTNGKAFCIPRYYPLNCCVQKSHSNTSFCMVQLLPCLQELPSLRRKYHLISLGYTPESTERQKIPKSTYQVLNCCDCSDQNKLGKLSK